MTFEDFIATKRWSDDLRHDVLDGPWGHEPPKGNVYLGSLYIEHIDDSWPEAARAGGEWYLVIGNTEWIDELPKLERILYDFAFDEGMDLIAYLPELTDDQLERLAANIDVGGFIPGIVFANDRPKLTNREAFIAYLRERNNKQR
jgi:hypothetical protein